MTGVLNILKTPGVSSHDVVARLRRILGERRIGHGGTLDPGAAGVLPIFVGRATKLMPYVADQKKRYRAELTLGIVTDTQDAAGAVIEVNTGFRISPRHLGDILASFLGEIEQTPPMASAIKHEGKRLYALARQGITVERMPRSVVIHQLRVAKVFPAGTENLVAGTRILIDVECSRGTYVRTLCHDIGARLGCGAHMSFLVRTAVGGFKLEESLSLEEIVEAAKAGRAEAALLPPRFALGSMPAVAVDDDGAARLRTGQAVAIGPTSRDEGLPIGTVQVVDAGGALVCIGRIEGEAVRPVRVL